MGTKPGLNFNYVLSGPLDPELRNEHGYGNPTPTIADYLQHRMHGSNELKQSSSSRVPLIHRFTSKYAGFWWLVDRNPRAGYCV
jgi:hypothetical protein